MREESYLSSWQKRVGALIAEKGKAKYKMRIDHRALPCPEIFGGNQRSSHPEYEPLGKRFRITQEMHKANLFKHYSEEKEKKQHLLSRGFKGRILPAIYP